MVQSRTHNCGELRLADAGREVTVVGWYENIRKVSKNLGFLILRDFLLRCIESFKFHQLQI